MMLESVVHAEALGTQITFVFAGIRVALNVKSEEFLIIVL